jgi:hypothetical protein
MTDCMHARGTRRLAVARKRQSTNVITGRRVVRRRIASSCPEHDDFDFLPLLRPRAQGHAFEQPARQHVTERHEHEASYERNDDPILRTRPIESVQAVDRIPFPHLHVIRPTVQGPCLGSLDRRNSVDAQTVTALPQTFAFWDDVNDACHVTSRSVRAAGSMPVHRSDVPFAAGTGPFVLSAVFARPSQVHCVRKPP